MTLSLFLFISMSGVAMADVSCELATYKSFFLVSTFVGELPESASLVEGQGFRYIDEISCSDGKVELYYHKFKKKYLVVKINAVIYKPVSSDFIKKLMPSGMELDKQGVCDRYYRDLFSQGSEGSFMDSYRFYDCGSYYRIKRDFDYVD